MPWRAFSASGPDSRPAVPTPRQPWPTRQAAASKANVGQVWRNSRSPCLLLYLNPLQPAFRDQELLSVNAAIRVDENDSVFEGRLAI